MLRVGDKGQSVALLQKLLNGRLTDRPKLPITGNYLQMTRAAVMAFQKSVGHLVNGVADARTWAALGHAEPTPEESPEPAWMAIARGEIGVAEIPTPGKHHPRIVEYLNTTLNISQEYRDRDETAWCAAFVNWVIKKAGMAGTNHALAKSWLDWGVPVEARPGCVVVIQSVTKASNKATGSNTGYHVGFCVASSSGSVKLLGGNQGDKVSIVNFYKSGYTVRGCRWPAAPDDVAPAGFAYA